MQFEIDVNGERRLVDVDPWDHGYLLALRSSLKLAGSCCTHCHPADDVPLQGENGDTHQPMVRRGAKGEGVTGLHCGTCHMAENFDPGGVPGAPNWHLARLFPWPGKAEA
ncbi:MAG: hypothetical protein AAGM22_00530 [Acidobacteriota bacterium]